MQCQARIGLRRYGNSRSALPTIASSSLTNTGTRRKTRRMEIASFISVQGSIASFGSFRPSVMWCKTCGEVSKRCLKMAIDRKTTPSATLPKITPQMAKSTEGGKASLMRTIRAELGESAAQFGATIAHTIDRHHRPFSRKYISALENSHARITPQIETALLRIAAALDESDPDLAVMQEVSVMVIDAASAGALVKG